MDLMTEYLVRSLIQQRLAAADEGREGRRLEKERRALRRRRWWGRTPAAPAPAAAPAAPVLARVLAPVLALADEVAVLLARAAYRVAEEGTASERRLLEAMAEVSAGSSAGAAAALVDWDGTETSRLRAFGLVHTHVVEVLGAREHTWLLDLVDGVDGVDVVDGVDATNRVA
jgi:hypothetical protein